MTLGWHISRIEPKTSKRCTKKHHTHTHHTHTNINKPPINMEVSRPATDRYDLMFDCQGASQMIPSTDPTSPDKSEHWVAVSKFPGWTIYIKVDVDFKFQLFFSKKKLENFHSSLNFYLA